MRTRIWKCGKSLALTIPHAVAKAAGLGAGAEVDVSSRGGNLIVKPIGRRTYRLNELLGRITSKNIHAEQDTGAPAGREAW